MEIKTSTGKIAAFFGAFLLSAGLAAVCLWTPTVSEWIAKKGNVNLLVYALFLISFCLFYFCLYAWLNRKHSVCRQASLPAFLAVTALTAGTVLFLIRMMQLEGGIYGGVSDRYVWHKLPLWLVLGFLAAEMILVLWCVREGTVHLPDQAMYLLYGTFTVLAGYTCYTPAVFNYGASNRLHTNAYYNSIYNVMHGAPYTEYTTSIYGHYGILYRWPLKLLGGDFVDFILLNTVLLALCFLAMFWALHLLVRNNLLRVLGTVAMTFPYLTMRGGYYWQLWPHRILFMSLLIAYTAWCVRARRLNRITCILGYGISMLAAVWNTESGVFCAVAWAAFWILKYLCEKKWRPGGILLAAVSHGAGVVFSFAGAWGAVNVYNVFHGGSVNSIREFLFPLMTTSYMDDLLRVDLPRFPSAYMPVLGLLCLSVAWGISHMKPFDRGESESGHLVPCTAFFAGVLTLGQMSYFMNRASYHNLDIVHLPAVLLMCLLAERGMGFLKRFRVREYRKYTLPELVQGAFSAVTLGLLVALCTGTAVQYGFNTDIKTQFHNKTDIHDFAAHIAANIPENTYAFGIGVAELYSMLRWDTGCYTLDFADLSVRPQVADYVINDIREKDLPGFLVGENTAKKFREFASDQNQWLEEHYEVSQEFEFNGAVLQYYTKK